jgi:DNA-binding response OmpR family regulator
MSVTHQVFTGFGVKRTHSCAGAEAAMTVLRSANVGLVICETQLSGGDGYDFVRALRRCEHEMNRRAPVILMTYEARHADVLRGRDAGANLVITRPLAPNVILQRIHWLRREPRPFIVAETYVGPDRRYHNLGPPAGMTGRRSGDLSAHVGAANTPNLSQNDIDNLFQARMAS